VAGVAGIGGVHLTANPVKEVIHRTGRTALNLLMLTLLVSPLRQLGGFTHLLRLRRLLGLFAYFYAVMHFTTYLVVDQGLNWASLWKDIAKRPYVTVGFSALVLLTALAATSTAGMMRRLGRAWTRLHRLIYVAAALVVVHFWWQVKADIREPRLYAIGLAVLLGYRVTRSRWFTSRFAPARAREKT
jgi:sulfoxide reductase heme-binding subunit YedZ